ncbi:MAG: PAS domain-containing protein [Pseudomonadota bacterium]
MTLDKRKLIDPELLQTMVNASNDGVVVAEQEGDENVLIYVNDAFERLTGYSAEEILYQDCRFLQGTDRDQPALQEVRAAIHAKQPCRVVLRNYRKDGTLFWNELSLTPVYSERDKLTYFIGIQKDVSRQVALAERLKLAEERLESVAQRLRELDTRR